MKVFLAFMILFVTVACQSNSQTVEGAVVQELESDMQQPPESSAPFKNCNVEQFGEYMKRNDAVVLDVRRPDETALGKIEGAVEINVLEEDFVEKLAELDKAQTYLVYCRSGRRSVTACNIMAEQGFGNLYNLEGGYNAWSAEKGN
ncbi:MAG: rhodanese-like domain-containing protein [Saprospiraceae bacterium]|nr:rhodanese-like domain-containing protein [Saprospiraceae bacterium]